MATSISPEENAQIDAAMAKAGRGLGLDSRFRERIKKALQGGVDIDVIASLIGVSKLGDVKKLREWFETQRYGTDLSAMDDDAVEDLIESLQGEVEDIAELEENRFYKDATIRDSDVHSDTYGQTIPRIEDGKPFGYVMDDAWIEGHEERMGVSPFDADPIKAFVKRYIFGNYGHMPQSEYDAMVKQLTDLQSMQTGREAGYNRGGIASFRPMGAVPTGVGMPMHMPRPPRGQMPPQGMQGGGVVTPFGMSLADTAEMASFSSQAQTASNAANGDLRGGIMSGQEAAGSGALGALSRQEFGTGRSLLPSFTTEERGMPGVEGQDPWQVEQSLYNRGGLTGQANKVAGAGRYGDTELVHMNPAEVQGLASLVPLTINPETGKPEAFLGMLLGVLGNYLAGTGMMAGVAGALGTSGIGSLLGSVITNPAIMGAIGSGGGTWAETGDLEKGILSGMMSFGIGDALQKTGAQSEGFLGSGAKGKELLSGTTVTDPVTAATAASTATELPAIAARPGVGPFGFGARAGQAATSGLPATASPAARDAVFKQVQADTIKANQGIFNQQPLGTRLGQAGSNLLTKEVINAFMNPINLSMISTGASGIGAIRAEEQYADWVEQQEEDRKRKRARMLGMPENIPQGVRQRFGLPAGGG